MTKRWLFVVLLATAAAQVILLVVVFLIGWHLLAPEQATRIVTAFNADRSQVKIQKYLTALDHRTSALEASAAHLNAASQTASVCTESLLTALSERQGWRLDTTNRLREIRRLLMENR